MITSNVIIKRTVRKKFVTIYLHETMQHPTSPHTLVGNYFRYLASKLDKLSALNARTPTKAVDQLLQYVRGESVDSDLALDITTELVEFSAGSRDVSWILSQYIDRMCKPLEVDTKLSLVLIAPVHTSTGDVFRSLASTLDNIVELIQMCLERDVPSAATLKQLGTFKGEGFPIDQLCSLEGIQALLRFLAGETVSLSDDTDEEIYYPAWGRDADEPTKWILHFHLGCIRDMLESYLVADVNDEHSVQAVNTSAGLPTTQSELSVA